MRFNVVLLACTMALSGRMIVRNPTPQELSALDNPPVEVQSKVAHLLPKAEAWYSETEIQLAPLGRSLLRTRQELRLNSAWPNQKKFAWSYLTNFRCPRTSNYSPKRRSMVWAVGPKVAAAMAASSC